MVPGDKSKESISLRNLSLHMGVGEASATMGRWCSWEQWLRPGQVGAARSVLEWMGPERGGCRAGKRAQ